MIIASETPDPNKDELAALRRAVNRTPKRSRIPVYGDACRASPEDLKEFIRPRLRNQIGTFKGVTLALEDSRSRSILLLPDKTLSIPDDIRERHVIVYGQTGSKKTQSTIFPAIHSDIAHRNSSLVIIVRDDVAARLATELVKRYRPSATVETICFGDRRRSTTTWNPFTATTDSTQILDRIQTFVSACHVDTDRIDSFWDGTSSRFIAGLANRFVDAGRTWSPADLYYAMELLSRPQLLELFKSGPPLPFANSSAAFIESGNQNAETSLAFAQAQLRFFSNPDIAAVTATGGYCHKQLFEKPKVVVLEVPLHFQETARPLVNLFVTSLLRESIEYASTQAGNRLPHPLNIYFDDFPLMTGKIPELAQQLNLVRSCGVRIFAASHSIGSIEHFFKSETKLLLAGFSTKIFKSPVEPLDAQWASDNSGTTTIDVHEINQERDPRISRLYRAKNRTVRQVARKLLLPEDVRLAPKHPVLGRASTVFLADKHVFQAWFPPAYSDDILGPILADIQNTTASSVRSAKEISEWKPMLKIADGQSTPLLYQQKHEEIYNQLRAQLLNEKDTPDDRIFWKQFEQQLRDKQQLVYVTKELLQRNATIAAYRKALVDGQTRVFEAALAFMDYQRLKNANRK